MTRTTTLPAELVDELAEMYLDTNASTGKRWTLRELAEFASKHLPEPITHMVVQRAIKPLLDERAELRREVIRTKALDTFGPHFDKLGSLMTKVAKDADEATTAAERRKSVNVYRLALDSHAKLLGMGDRVEVSGSMDVTSGGQPLRIYLPAEQPFDDEPAPEAEEA